MFGNYFRRINLRPGFSAMATYSKCSCGYNSRKPWEWISANRSGSNSDGPRLVRICIVNNCHHRVIGYVLDSLPPLSCRNQGRLHVGDSRILSMQLVEQLTDLEDDED